MRRIPKMRADHALAVLEMAADLGRGDSRTVAGENRVRRDQLLDLGKDPLLERQLLRRRFEHECCTLDCRSNFTMRGDALQEDWIVTEKIGDRLQPRRH